MAGEENNEGVDVAGGTSRYSEQIENDAKSFGYKAANLLNLRDVVKKFNELLATNQDSQLGDNIIKVQVPAFEPVKGDVIKQHLDTHASEWKDLFQKFADTYQAQSNLDTLSEASIECLKKLQECIINCFNQHELEPGLFNKFLEKNKIQPDQLLMVRSTGVHEDKADMANPGGNESLPCKANIREISQALGRVAASYVGPKSLAQRLIARDQHITDFPVMPGLIQQMIGEGMDVSQTADRQNKVPVSGVIYSKDGASRLQVAPGHGEYVVNSKGRVDNFYISTQGVVYCEIAAKDFRLQPKLDKDSQKISLERQENPAELKYQPSIASDVAYYAHQFAQYLVEKYGKRMDIEFVYNPDDHQINIVQARAIPEGSRKGLEPSAISPQFLADNKATMTIIQGLQVITPEVNKVAVITDPSQVIICNTIEEALTQYNKNHDKIAGVIVQQPSPDTSHEAGVFNASAIPVMQVSDIVAVQELLKKNNHLIIDPQHSSVYQLSEAKFRELDQINIEKALYDTGIVAKGIYASSLSGYVTPINYSFSKENLSDDPVTLDKNPSIGKLANEAQAGNKLSTDQLLSLAHQAINFRLPQNVEAPLQNKAEKLRDNIAALSLPKIGESNEQAKEALGYNLRAVTYSYNKRAISVDLFKQTMIAGAELSVLLDKMQHLSSNTQQQREQAYLEYFNVQKKFTGMIIGAGGKNILADSLAISLKQNKYAKQAGELINKFLPDGTATDKQKAYLTESIKLADYFLSKEKQQEWRQFCGKICTARTDDNKLNELPAKRLGKLVNQLVSLGVHQQWLNLIFTADNNPDHSLQTLGKLVKGFNDIDLSKIQKAKATIDSMQAQIPQWSDPAKFSELFKGLQENISNLNRQLKWNSQASNLEKILILEQVNQLTDILDKSTKSLERSTLYPDNAKDKNGNDLQVAHFKDMVGEFYDLMKVWVAEGKFKGDELAQNSLEEIIRSFQVQGKQILTKNQFNPSPYFSVNRATINITGDRTIPDTLEDILTLIHQNMIVVITDLATETNKILYQQLPNLVKNLDIAFNNELLDSSNPYYSDRISNLSTMISLKNQTLIIEKNIPLRAHSCIASIKYNVKDGAFVKFTMLGFNEQNRWDNITLDTYLQFTKAGIEFVIPPRHDKEKGIFEYEIKIKEEQIESLIDMINKSIDISYKLSVENKPQASEVKQELLVDRLNLLSKFSNAELNKVANMAKIILMEPEQFGQFELLGDSNLERLTTLFQFCNKNELVRAVIGNLGSLAEKLPNLYIDNILDNQETLNSSTWEFLKSKSPYNKEIFIDKLFALQNSADDKSLNLFKDILIQGSKDLVSVLDQNTQLFFIEELFKLQDKNTLHTTLNEILINNSENWLQNLNSSNKFVLASKLLEQQDFEKTDDKIRYLTSDNATELYAAGIKFIQLAKLQPDDIIALTSDSAVKIFKEKYATFDQLENLESDKIKLLMSPTVLNMYEEQRATFDDLKDTELGKIQYLISYEAQRNYARGVAFTLLKHCGLEEGKKLADTYEANPTKADKQQIKKCVEAITREYPDNSPEFNKAINDFVDKLAISRQITNKGADNSPEETRKYLVTTLEQLAADDPALSTPLERIKLSNVVQYPNLQAAIRVLVNHGVTVTKDSNMSINHESSVAISLTASCHTTHRR